MFTVDAMLFGLVSSIDPSGLIHNVALNFEILSAAAISVLFLSASAIAKSEALRDESSLCFASAVFSSVAVRIHGLEIEGAAHLLAVNSAFAALTFSAHTNLFPFSS